MQLNCVAAASSESRALAPSFFAGAAWREAYGHTGAIRRAIHPACASTAVLPLHQLLVRAMSVYVQAFSSLTSNSGLPMKDAAPTVRSLLRRFFRSGLFPSVLSFEFLELLLQPQIVSLKIFEL